MVIGLAEKKEGFCENRVEKRGDFEKMRIFGERNQRLEAGTEGQREEQRRIYCTPQGPFLLCLNKICRYVVYRTVLCSVFCRGQGSSPWIFSSPQAPLEN